MRMDDGRTMKRKTRMHGKIRQRKKRKKKRRRIVEM